MELVQQAVGEYEEKLAASQLEAVINAPENEIVYGLVDGNLMWRVLSNLLSNACLLYTSVQMYRLPVFSWFHLLPQSDPAIVLAFFKILFHRQPDSFLWDQVGEQFCPFHKADTVAEKVFFVANVCLLYTSRCV